MNRSRREKRILATSEFRPLIRRHGGTQYFYPVAVVPPLRAERLARDFFTGREKERKRRACVRACARARYSSVERPNARADRLRLSRAHALALFKTTHGDSPRGDLFSVARSTPVQLPVRSGARASKRKELAAREAAKTLSRVSLRALEVAETI